MTVRQYWVHYDEPLDPAPPPTSAVSHPDTSEPGQWEPLFHALLDLIEPHAELYRAALKLLAGLLPPRPPASPPPLRA